MLVLLLFAAFPAQGSAAEHHYCVDQDGACTTCPAGSCTNLTTQEELNNWQNAAALQTGDTVSFEIGNVSSFTEVSIVFTDLEHRQLSFNAHTNNRATDTQVTSLDFQHASLVACSLGPGNFKAESRFDTDKLVVDGGSFNLANNRIQATKATITSIQALEDYENLAFDSITFTAFSIPSYCIQWEPKHLGTMEKVEYSFTIPGSYELKVSSTKFALGEDFEIDEDGAAIVHIVSEHGAEITIDDDYQNGTIEYNFEVTDTTAFRYTSTTDAQVPGSILSSNDLHLYINASVFPLALNSDASVTIYPEMDTVFTSPINLADDIKIENSKCFVTIEQINIDTVGLRIDSNSNYTVNKFVQTASTSMLEVAVIGDSPFTLGSTTLNGPIDLRFASPVRFVNESRISFTTNPPPCLLFPDTQTYPDEVKFTPVYMDAGRSLESIDKSVIGLNDFYNLTTNTKDNTHFKLSMLATGVDGYTDARNCFTTNTSSSSFMLKRSRWPHSFTSAYYCVSGAMASCADHFKNYEELTLDQPVTTVDSPLFTSPDFASIDLVLIGNMAANTLLNFSAFDHDIDFTIYGAEHFTKSNISLTKASVKRFHLNSVDLSILDGDFSIQRLDLAGSVAVSSSSTMSHVNTVSICNDTTIRDADQLITNNTLIHQSFSQLRLQASQFWLDDILITGITYPHILVNTTDVTIIQEDAHSVIVDCSTMTDPTTITLVNVTERFTMIPSSCTTTVKAGNDIPIDYIANADFAYNVRYDATDGNVESGSFTLHATAPSVLHMDTSTVEVLHSPSVDITGDVTFDSHIYFEVAETNLGTSSNLTIERLATDHLTIGGGAVLSVADFLRFSALDFSPGPSAASRILLNDGATFELNSATQFNLHSSLSDTFPVICGSSYACSTTNASAPGYSLSCGTYDSLHCLLAKSSTNTPTASPPPPTASPHTATVPHTATATATTADNSNEARLAIVASVSVSLFVIVLGVSAYIYFHRQSEQEQALLTLDYTPIP